MKPVRTVALSRLSAPTFTALTESEVIRLRQLPAWQRWLYLELVSLSDFATGAGRASWAQLVALLDFDRMPGRPVAGAEVSRDQARRAVDALQAAGLVARDKGRNEAQGSLFFHVSPRAGFSTPARTSARTSARGVTASKPKRGAASAATLVTLSPPITPGVSRVQSIPLTPTDAELSTGDAPALTKAERAALVARTKASIAGGKIKPPQGAESFAG